MLPWLLARSFGVGHWIAAFLGDCHEATDSGDSINRPDRRVKTGRRGTDWRPPGFFSGKSVRADRRASLTLLCGQKAASRETTNHDQ
jgi:hypothetical protein